MKYVICIIIFAILFTGCLGGASGGISFGGRGGAGLSSTSNSSSATAADTTPPTVTNVNSNTAAGTYGIGAVIDVRIIFSEAVTVTGTPVITLETGATDRNASYASGTGTTELVFNYTIQSGDSSSDLDYTVTTSLALAGGTIKDAAGNNATLTLVAPAAAGSLGANEAIVIDTTSKVIQVAAGSFFTCALLSTGTVRCWGNDADGRIGYGNANNIGDNETPASAGDVNIGGVVVQLAAGDDFACALLSTGTVRCWGQATEGQLGYGNTNSVGDNEAPSTAGDLSLGGTAIQITAGASHACAVLSDGNAKCWGSGLYLGYGNTDNIGDDELPSTVGNLSLGGRVTQIDAGRAHTCALLSDGTVRCWGDGSFGALGYGNVNWIGDDEFPSAVGIVSIGTTAKQIAVGVFHTCALLSDGNVKCWGYGDSGRLGYGNTNNIGDNELPSTIGNVSLGGNAIQITVAASDSGEGHSCALLEDGNVKCWGSNVSGQLGYGNTSAIGDNELPSTAGNISLGNQVAQVSAGGLHTCALLVNGEVKCWGENGEGELGYANTNGIGDDELPSTVGTVYIGGSQAVKQIAVGGVHACALLADGNVKCWGKGGIGELGYANTNNIGDNELPSTIGNVSVGGVVVQLAAGHQHTCALLSDGNVRCWGDGGAGTLGYGVNNDVGDDETPASVGNVSIGGTAIQITAGLEHTCALLSTGDVRCWGNSAYGVLGYGNATIIGDDELPSSVGPVDIHATEKVIQIATGTYHNCALLSNGAVRCWGWNGSGHLGYGHTNDIGDNELPSTAGDVSIDAVQKVIQITAGDEHTCALLDNGEVKCWGGASQGYLGYGNTNDIGDDELPSTVGYVNVHATEKVKQISVGYYDTCALLTNGAVRCWGNNSNGSLGYGNTNDIGDDEDPVTAGSVSLGALAVQIWGGEHFHCALLVGGSVRCWGRNSLGQLGQGNTTTIGDDELPSTVGAVSVF